MEYRLLGRTRTLAFILPRAAHWRSRRCKSVTFNAEFNAESYSNTPELCRAPLRSHIASLGAKAFPRFPSRCSMVLGVIFILGIMARPLAERGYFRKLLAFSLESIAVRYYSSPLHLQSSTTRVQALFTLALPTRPDTGPDYVGLKRVRANSKKRQAIGGDLYLKRNHIQCTTRIKERDAYSTTETLLWGYVSCAVAYCQEDWHWGLWDGRARK